jgi:sugar/nucleoside kinase (ribokinase family)
MTTNKPELAVVGHFSNDLLKLPSRLEPYTVLGGAVAYSSIVAQRLGTQVLVISKVGSDFPPAYQSQLLSEGIDLSGVTTAEEACTTSFELTYNADLSSRTLKLTRQGPPITLNDLPRALYAKVIHLAPIAAEISYPVVAHLRQCCTCLSIDPQGMTRRFDQNGNVTCAAQIDPRILPLVDVYKSSFEELTALTQESDLVAAVKKMHTLGPELVVVTLGSQGAVLSVQGKLSSVAAYGSKSAVDPTGAGDAFIGAFLSQHIRQKTPFWSASVGSAASSLVVEGVGTNFSLDLAEVNQRVHIIQKKRPERSAL